MVICLTKRLLDQKHHLSKIWLAAHWEKKVKRQQIFEIDIEKCIQEMIEAEIFLDLRISGHLLVGIARIHAKKTKYLLSDCNEILSEVKIFHAGRIDLPHNNLTASVDDITLEEYLSDNLDKVGDEVIEALFSCNQGRIEDITLKETAAERSNLLDDETVNFGFHEEDEPFEFTGDNLLSACHEFEALREFEALTAEHLNDTTAEQPKHATVVLSKKITVYNQITLISLKEGNKNFEASEEERLDEFQPNFERIDEYALSAFDPKHQIKEIPESLDLSRLMNGDVDREFYDNRDISSAPENAASDALELEPLNDKKYMRAKNRKRKLCIDYVKRLPERDLDRQIMDTSDIISTSHLAPCNKRLMMLKEIGSAEKLLSLPSLKLQSKTLLKVYERNLKTRPCDDFDSDPEEDNINPKPQKRRQTSRCETPERPDINGNMLLDIVDSPAFHVGRITNLNADNSFLDPIGNLMGNEAIDGLFENQGACGFFGNQGAGGLFGNQGAGGLFEIQGVGGLFKNQGAGGPFENQAINDGLENQATDGGLENQVYDVQLTENLPSSHLQISSVAEFQSTPMSRTSQEKWEYALQGRIINTLSDLKPLFKEGQSKVPFSSIAKNKKRLWVAQKFHSLLMLQKCEVISLDQQHPYDEIFINPSSSFDNACSKFSSD